MILKKLFVKLVVHLKCIKLLLLFVFSLMVTYIFHLFFVVSIIFLVFEYKFEVHF